MKPYRLVSSYKRFAENVYFRRCPTWSRNVEAEISSKHQLVFYDKHRLIYHNIWLSLSQYFCENFKFVF